jgi:hypothetical protein
MRRISGSRKFRPTLPKDFFNSIGTFETSRDVRYSVAIGGRTNIEDTLGGVMVIQSGGNVGASHGERS